MTSIRLPIPYTVYLSTQKNGKRVTSSVQGCEIGDFEIPDYRPDDVTIVASWDQAWGKENHIGIPALFESEPDEWKKAFQARPAMNRLILIGDTFYSPLKLVPRQAAATYLATDANLQSLLILSDQYSTLACSGEVSTFFGSSSPYRKNLVSSGYLKNVGIVVKPAYRGKTREGDSLEQVTAAMHGACQSMAVIDGMIWIPISEPCLRLSTSGDDAVLSVSHGPAVDSDGAMRFSLTDFAIAKEILDTHFSADKVAINVADIRIDIPSALRTSMEYDEVCRGLRRFHALTNLNLKVFSLECGTLWFDIKELIGTSIVDQEKVLDESVVEQAVAKVEQMVALLPHETVVDHFSVDRAVAIGRMLVDRWQFRPVDAVPSKGI
jgi:hypothetical protein